MNFIKLSLVFKSLMSRSLISKPRAVRSVQASALILVLAATSGSIALAQSQPLTWQNALAKLFGRQQQKGGTRGPSFCSVTPIYYGAISRPEGRVFNSLSQRLLTEKPLIVWYGNVGSVEIRKRKTTDEAPIVLPLPKLSKPEEKGKLISENVLNQVQYSGEALLPDQDYELRFTYPTDSKTVLERYTFRTLSQADRNRMTLKLKDLAAKATKTNSDPILPQVEFLLQQNLLNDAQMLILQQTNPSPELQAAIAATQNPCEVKFKIKTPPSLAPTPMPTTTP
jgi:hypothetical protein